MSFHSPQVSPVISDRSVWHRGKHPEIQALLRKRTGKNIGEKLANGSCATFLFLLYFDVICDLSWTDARQNGIYLELQNGCKIILWPMSHPEHVYIVYIRDRRLTC